MSEKASIQIDIDKKLCKACGICTGLCPRQVFTKDDLGYPVATHIDKCIDCKLCELRCPDFAIRVGRKA
jgi:2-oxoglutarate ferredoxin oxidoreductase subunit delta